MDLQIIAYWLFELSTYAWVIDPGAWIIILKVAIGLGMVIFVHELGHFGVAKLCGVQCDKFYLGFDIGGWKLCKFKWGETEYGIGILPLGGYVKMLGQEDNPARLKEELERAKARRAAGGTGGLSTGDVGKTSHTPSSLADKPPVPPIDIEAAEQALYNPRSYLAKSVPQRMAIISAGVIMNIIFAFICAVAAFYMGVRQTACVVGQVQPGSPAWLSGLQSGDSIVSIAGKKAHSFRDILSGVTLGDNEDGVKMVIQRPGESGQKTIVVRPTLSTGLFPTIGVSNSYTMTFSDELEDGQTPVFPDSVAARVEIPFKPGDKIVKIGDVKIENYADISRCLYQQVDKSIAVTVERPIEPDGNQPADSQSGNGEGEGKNVKNKSVTIEVPAQPMRRFGLQMAMGPVLAVKSGSPAAKAGIEPGDVIVKIDGRDVGDPMTLDARLRKLQAKKIPLELDRNGRLLTVEIVPEPVDIAVEPIQPGGAVGVPLLGVAYDVQSTVAAVGEGSSAQRQGVKPGDVIVEASVILPDDGSFRRLGYDRFFSKSGLEKCVKFSAEKPNWPDFFYSIAQKLPPRSRVKFKLADGRDVTLDLHDCKDWFNIDRGFLLEPLTILRQAESFGDAVSLGYAETIEAATAVFVFIKKISDGQISPRALGGPVSIAKVAGHEASKGTAELLLFLTLLSANLAVLNFLPIPVLDGGHMVFLAWEGIRGRPADERIQLVLSYIGLMILVALMIFVVGLDFNFISRE